jgi:hypothetical protein
MANTTLPTTGVVSDDPAYDHKADHYIIHTEVNKLSRDTGRRNVASLLINGWTATTIEMQRVNERTYLRIKGLNGSAATNSRFLEVPTGFQPPDVMESAVMRNSAGGFTLYITGSLSGGFTMPTGSVFGTASQREWSIPCTATWPVTLPGVAI